MFFNMFEYFCVYKFKNVPPINVNFLLTFQTYNLNLRSEKGLGENTPINGVFPQPQVCGCPIITRLPPERPGGLASRCTCEF